MDIAKNQLDPVESDSDSHYFQHQEETRLFDLHSWLGKFLYGAQKEAFLSKYVTVQDNWMW